MSKLDIKVLKERWIAETPLFWKSFIKVMITLGTSSASILLADDMFHLEDRGVSPIIFKVCGYIIAACASMGLTAKLTIKSGDHP